MKNVMVANLLPKSRTNKEELVAMAQAQIENSLDLGWKPEDICLITNFDFEHAGVTAIKTNLNEHCSTGSKMFGIRWLVAQNLDNVYWAHDLDCWQDVAFEPPKFKDVGICEYSLPKYNGGSVFWRDTSKDIIEHVTRTLEETNATREEPTLNKVLKSKEYRDRVTVLNTTFNLGCSGFVKRYERAIKPIHASHFHPTNRIAWESHALNRSGLGYRSVSPRLEALLRRFWPELAYNLHPKDLKNKLRSERRRSMIL